VFDYFILHDLRKNGIVHGALGVSLTYLIFHKFKQGSEVKAMAHLAWKHGWR